MEEQGFGGLTGQTGEPVERRDMIAHLPPEGGSSFGSQSTEKLKINKQQTNKIQLCIIGFTPEFQILSIHGMCVGGPSTRSIRAKGFG